MNQKNITIIKTNNAPIPTGPYVQAININKMIFISGQIPICPKTNQIPETIYHQTYQSLQNIRKIIQKINLEIINIIKTTLFVTNINDINEINLSYYTFFKKYSSNNNIHLPARSCIEVTKLPKNVKIEVEAIAMYLE